jgi:hypothetical protein
MTALWVIAVVLAYSAGNAAGEMPERAVDVSWGQVLAWLLMSCGSIFFGVAAARGWFQ